MGKLTLCSREGEREPRNSDPRTSTSTMKEDFTLKNFHDILRNVLSQENPHPEAWEILFWIPDIFAEVNKERWGRLAGAPGLQLSHPVSGQGLEKADCVIRCRHAVLCGKFFISGVTVEPFYFIPFMVVVVVPFFFFQTNFW